MPSWSFYFRITLTLILTLVLNPILTLTALNGPLLLIAEFWNDAFLKAQGLSPTTDGNPNPNPNPNSYPHSYPNTNTIA
jgi:hypothetical protein